MHVLITGAGGTVGRFITRLMLDKGHQVTVLGRQPLEGWQTAFCRYDLADTDPDLPAGDALIHCALFHEQGKFRGGEGKDPDRFRHLNVEGTAALFKAARAAGCGQAVFLSSRAVYGDHRAGDLLRETDQAAPDTLYGQVKAAGEAALADLSGPLFRGSVLRATGVYGGVPGLETHKWSGLFKAFAEGEDLAPRIGTEVHGKDLADAVALVLAHEGAGAGSFEIYNVSDLVLDRHELLTLYCKARGLRREVPPKADVVPGIMATDKLRALGWSPGGRERLREFLQAPV